jgi:SIR2-like domain
MPRSLSPDGIVTLVLGAGASRSVSYAASRDLPSPLDRDFFDLLQRRRPRHTDRVAVDWVLDNMATLPADYRRSLERAFYTLQVRAHLRHKLAAGPSDEEANLVGYFARAVVGVLREAHGKEICRHHLILLRDLQTRDAVISFNYDLVPERALRLSAGPKVTFSPKIYCLNPDETPPPELPKLLKLHGSVNWTIDGKDISVRTQDWRSFDEAPGYRGYKGEGTKFPIFLPFWDKRVTNQPWLPLWREAHAQLRRTKYLIVWGFSLPLTDVKARELFSIATADGGGDKRLCVIDPSQQTRDRWRDLLPNAQYWEYQNIYEFLSASPTWWWRKGTYSLQPIR